MSSIVEPVHVVCGWSERRLDLGGRQVAYVKRSLRDAFNIPYFAHAYLNGSIVDLSAIVAGGDTLVFHQQFGFKGSGEGQQRLEEIIAEALHLCSPELRAIGMRVKQMGLAHEESIDRTIELVSQHFIRYFGPVGVGEQPVVSALARMMVVQEERLNRLETRVFEPAPPQEHSSCPSAFSTPPPPPVSPEPSLVPVQDKADQTNRPEIDVSRFTMRWKGKRYQFKNTRAFWVLACLADRFGELVPVIDLVDEVWNDSETQQNTVHRTISNLRYYLGELHITDLAIDGTTQGHYRLHER